MAARSWQSASAPLAPLKASVRRSRKALTGPFTSKSMILSLSTHSAPQNYFPKLFAAKLQTCVLTGLQSDDIGAGQPASIIAELLGLPHATIIMSVEVQPDGIKVKRELEGGWFQHVELPLPAVLAIQSGINKLRYATLMGIKKAKSKEIKRLTPEELGGMPARQVEVAAVYLPQRSKQTQMLDGNARDAAAKLVEKLRFEVRAI